MQMLCKAAFRHPQPTPKAKIDADVMQGGLPPPTIHTKGKKDADTMQGAFGRPTSTPEAKTNYAGRPSAAHHPQQKHR